MELVTVVGATLDLAALQCLDDRGNALEERVGVLVVVETAVERRFRPTPYCLQDHLFGPTGHLVTHQNADLVELLPRSVERHQCTCFEVPGRNVEGVGNLTPFAQVAQPIAAARGVVDDEQRSRLAPGSVPCNSAHRLCSIVRHFPTPLVRGSTLVRKCATAGASSFSSGIVMQR